MLRPRVSGWRSVRLERGPSRTASTTTAITATLAMANALNTGALPQTSSANASGVEASITAIVPGTASTTDAAIV